MLSVCNTSNSTLPNANCNIVAARMSRDAVELDYKFEFSPPNFSELRIGELVLSDTFTHDGVCWQLEFKKIPHRNADWVQVECHLHLLTRGNDKPKLARICLLVPKLPSSTLFIFLQNGDKSDSVKFKCKSDVYGVILGVEVFKCLKATGLKRQIEPPKSQMSAELLKWFKTETFGDTTIVASDGQTFRCHKDILARRSEVFMLMFNTPMKESRENLVNIDDYDGEIVALLLQFIYTDDCGQIGSIADRLYSAAHQYQLERLKSLCESAMAADLSATTIVNTYRLANFYHLDRLLDISVDYLDRNKAELPVAKLLAEAIMVAEVPESKRIKIK